MGVSVRLLRRQASSSSTRVNESSTSNKSRPARLAETRPAGAGRPRRGQERRTAPAAYGAEERAGQREIARACLSKHLLGTGAMALLASEARVQGARYERVASVMTLRVVELLPARARVGHAARAPA